MKRIYEKVVQGTDEWMQLRCGILTASEMHHLVTPSKLEPAWNDAARSYLLDLAAQRISGFVDASFTSKWMERGKFDEPYARDYYADNFEPVRQVGFVSNEIDGVIIGYSPDGLVGDNGAIEAKSRNPSIQLGFILDRRIPTQALIQVQTGMLVAELDWIDYVSYSGGLAMAVERVYRDDKIQAAIRRAAVEAEARIKEIVARYEKLLEDPEQRLVPTERVVDDIMIL